MNRKAAAVACWFLAGIVALVGSLVATLGSVPALAHGLGVDPSASWYNRLLANLLGVSSPAMGAVALVVLLALLVVVGLLLVMIVGAARSKRRVPA
jgi:hypothetical protein